MKRFLKWLLSSISRKIAADYASGDNGWDKAVTARQVLDSTKRLMTSAPELAGETVMTLTPDQQCASGISPLEVRGF